MNTQDSTELAKSSRMSDTKTKIKAESRLYRKPSNPFNVAPLKNIAQ
jgi:hypothetical protein